LTDLNCVAMIQSLTYRRLFMEIVKKTTQHILRWLQPGLGVKRWILIILLGTIVIALGAVIFVVEFYNNTPDAWWISVLSLASLRSLPRIIRVLIFEVLGVAIIIWGIAGLNRSLIGPFIRPGHSIVDSLEKHQSRKHGPKIVVIGGGHGLSTILRGLKKISHNIYAVVTVADDGGSSGRLRENLGILPPGDVRNCLAALSDDEDLLAQLFQYRFTNSDSGLEGHSFGNLFISSMAEVTGSFEQAIAESGRVLAVSGRVLPATLENVKLVADIEDRSTGEVFRVVGESKITETEGDIRRVMLEPSNPAAYPEVIQSILSADIILIGPGSLYTSILPNLLVKDITSAIRTSRGLRIFVCNVATQAGETEGFSCGDHLAAVEDHVGGNILDIIVANDLMPGQFNNRVEGVVVEDNLQKSYAVYKSDLIDESHPWRHDPDKVTRVIMDLFRERTGPLTME